MAIRFGISLDVSLPPVTPFAKPRTRLYPGAATGEPFGGSREQQTYRAGVGSLNWLAITNRPDLAFAISQLAHFPATPTATHSAALVHVLKYVVVTRHFTLCYIRQCDHKPSHQNGRSVYVRDSKPAGGILRRRLCS